MKKLLLIITLTLLPLSAANFFLAYGVKVADNQGSNLISTTVKGSILTGIGAIGLGKDHSVGLIPSDFSTLTQNSFGLGFDYVHYGFLIDLSLFKVGIGYDIGLGSAYSSSAVENYLQMEASVDALIPLGKQFALNIGYAYPFIFSETLSNVGVTNAQIAQQKFTFGIRLISRD